MPIVDDAFTFGQIAAANAISDVYAMGGKPVAALNIVGFPDKKLPLSVLTEILRGGQDAVHEAGAYFYCDGANFNAIVGKVRPGDLGVDAMHIRFHTVFGANVPQPHMFLGQMLTALVSGDDFRMSSGTQFREYQHVDDIAAAIQIVSGNRGRAAVTIAHGQPIQLGELAQRVFESFDRLDSLKIGALPDQVPDVTAPLGGKLPELAALSFRDTIPAVIDYMHDAARV